MSKDDLSIQQAVDRLVQADEASVNRITQIEQQMGQLTRALNSLNEIIKSRLINRERSTEDNDTDGTSGEVLETPIILAPTTDMLTSPEHLSGEARPRETIVDKKEPEEKSDKKKPETLLTTGIKHSIIVPPSSASPIYHGRNTESPTQFLVRVEEYAESVHGWDLATLVTGVSQFLQNSALEWYCQLRLTKRKPKTWEDFKDLFLAQFNSPIRKARQEREWHECKQKENETINEFLVRLRALWREQKPKETEVELVKHLFCRMRTDLLSMIGVSRNATLDELIKEVQQIEDVLYRRAKGERLAKYNKLTTSTNWENNINKRFNEEDSKRQTTWQKRKEFPHNVRREKDHQVNEIIPGRIQTTTEPYWTQQAESNEIQCFNCGNYGHLARHCPGQTRNHRQDQNRWNSKNVRGALEERTSHAPM
jgi:hypothetical protein